MPRILATRRASSTAEREQHPPSWWMGRSLGQSCMVTPITSYPCSRRSAAATELATPPLMAANTRAPMAPPSLPSLSPQRAPSGDGRPADLQELRPRPGQDLQHPGHLGLGGGRSQAQPEAAPSQLHRQPAGQEHGGGLEGARRAGGPAGGGHPFQIQPHEEGFAVDAAFKDEAGQPRQALGRVAREAGAGGRPDRKSTRLNPTHVKN